MAKVGIIYMLEALRFIEGPRMSACIPSLGLGRATADEVLGLWRVSGINVWSTSSNWKPGRSNYSHTGKPRGWVQGGGNGSPTKGLQAL